MRKSGGCGGVCDGFCKQKALAVLAILQGSCLGESRCESVSPWHLLAYGSADCCPSCQRVSQPAVTQEGHRTAVTLQAERFLPAFAIQLS